MNLKHINIIDHCFSKNNLGKSISIFNSHRMKEAFRMQDQLLSEIESKALKKFKKGKSINDFILKNYCNMFKYTLECNSVLPPISLKMP